MGIILLPFIGGSFIIFLFCLYKFYKVFKVFKLSHLFLGILLSLSIYGILLYSYYIDDNPYNLSPYFLFPFVMIYLPFTIPFINLILKKNISSIINISIIISGIFNILFNNLTFGIIEFLGKKGHY